jgi:hypothetical protein
MEALCMVLIVAMLLTYVSGIPGLGVAGDFLGPLNLRSS